MFLQYKPDLSFPDDNHFLSLVLIHLTVILDLEIRQIYTSGSDVYGTGYQSGQKVLNRVNCELQGNPVTTEGVLGSSGCALQAPGEYRATDLGGSSFQDMSTRQYGVVAAKQIRISVDCNIPFIISTFLPAWKNKKWFVNLLRGWGVCTCWWLHGKILDVGTENT